MYVSRPLPPFERSFRDFLFGESACFGISMSDPYTLPMIYTAARGF
jgi:hypothetical protein